LLKKPSMSASTIQHDATRSMVRLWVALGCLYCTPNRIGQFTQKAGAGKQATFLVLFLSVLRLGLCRGMKLNAHSVGRADVVGPLPREPS
jgi:hypothetical protein